MITAIVGANWGDEGKGKVTDMLACDADYVVRFQGGANAGHTIINNYGRFALHLLPSGIFNENTVNILANGVALNIPFFINELKSIIDAGVKEPTVYVSDRAHIVMPYHLDFDKYEEERLSKASFGSTKSGIAYIFADKYQKIGFEVNELYDEEYLSEKLDLILPIKNAILKELYHKEPLKKEDVLKTLLEYGEMIKPYVKNTSKMLRKAIKDGKKILFEGQLGTLKDTDHGIYPMVTSSSTLAGYASIGAGVPPYEIKNIIAVTKAYSSAVGAGEFVSEIFDEEANGLRTHGGDKGEFGATTGRPRRVGWFDVVATKYGIEMQGATDIAFMVIDALSYLDEIPVCVSYEIDGEITDEFPNTSKLKKAKPVLERLKGWKSDIRGITKYEELPKEARDYIEFIEEKLGKKFKYISTGPKREEMIIR